MVRPATGETTMRDAGFADFDFLIGEWTITNEFLKQRLVGATEWETFPATSRVEKVMDGGGNLDQMFMPGARLHRHDAAPLRSRRRNCGRSTGRTPRATDCSRRPSAGSRTVAANSSATMSRAASRCACASTGPAASGRDGSSRCRRMAGRRGR